jgi:flagellar biosynthesis/type III secretory pathway protein FliH
MKTNKERAREIVLKSKCMGYTGPAHDPVTSQTVDSWIEASIEAELDEAFSQGREQGVREGREQGIREAAELVDNYPDHDTPTINISREIEALLKETTK